MHGLLVHNKKERKKELLIKTAMCIHLKTLCEEIIVKDHIFYNFMYMYKSTETGQVCMASHDWR